MDPSLQQQNLEEYSASATIVKFDRPVPLLRGPIAAGPFDDPTSGPYLLAFKDLPSWAAAYKSCHSKMLSQCEEGARIGCAIAASNKCKPPWWQSLTGWKPVDLKERERCEDREMEVCLEAAKEKCVDFAKEKCATPFLDARIAVSQRELRNRMAGRMVQVASTPVESRWPLHLNLIVGLDKSEKGEFRVTNYRASESLSSGMPL